MKFILILFAIILPEWLNFDWLKSNRDKKISSNIEYSMDLYKDISKNGTSENTVICPLSSYYSLSMLMNGAGEETRNEIKEALRTEDQLNNINQSNRLLMESIKSDSVDIIMSNSIWLDDNIELKQGFSRTLNFKYRSKVNVVDFSDKFDAKDEINKWVSKNTRGRIPEVINEVSDRQNMYLINAQYFSGNWKHPFDPKKTIKKEFTNYDGSKSTVEIMKQVAQMKYHENSMLQMLEMSYLDEDFAMTVILPRNGIEDIVDYFNKNNWEIWNSEVLVTEVSVEIPKFTLDSEIDLIEPHRAMGMKLPFHYYADFSKISTMENLFINSFFQKTYIKVDEKGSEPAGVTSIGISTTSVKPKPFIEFHVDKPFVFLIWEKSTNSILFIGEINEL